ncbi:MAG: hypothetical protein PVH21_16925 [Myxococcales bacterium]|jgi:hypothetical protein
MVGQGIVAAILTSCTGFAFPAVQPQPLPQRLAAAALDGERVATAWPPV